MTRKTPFKKRKDALTPIKRAIARRLFEEGIKKINKRKDSLWLNSVKVDGLALTLLGIGAIPVGALLGGALALPFAAFGITAVIGGQLSNSFGDRIRDEASTMAELKTPAPMSLSKDKPILFAAYQLYRLEKRTTQQEFLSGKEVEIGDSTASTRAFLDLLATETDDIIKARQLGSTSYLTEARKSRARDLAGVSVGNIFDDLEDTFLKPSIVKVRRNQKLGRVQEALKFGR